MIRKKVRLIECVRCAEDAYILRLYAPDIVKEAEPGQFIMVQIPSLYTIVRRPFSIADAVDDCLHLLIRIVGEGTEHLCRLKAGMTVDVIAPLGSGFSIKGRGRVILIGGGIGIAPLIFLLKKVRQKGAHTTLVFGADRKEHLYLADYVGRLSDYTVLVTEDGSRGEKGTALDVAERLLSGDNNYDFIYACGPQPMLKGVTRLATRAGIDGEISLETRMLCGLGLCRCCTLITRNHNIRLCREGPVVPIRSLL